MNNESLFDKISSKYIIQIINSYLVNENLIYKLIFYNHHAQGRLDISLNNYKELYFLKRINFDNYLYEEYCTNTLTENLRNDAINYGVSENYLKKLAINYYTNLIEKKSKEIKNTLTDLKKINVSSPIFEDLSKLDNFGKTFCIAINLHQIDKNNLNINDIINKLKNIKNINSFNFDYWEINELKKYFPMLNGINFEQIKKLSIITRNRDSCAKIRDLSERFTKPIMSLNIGKNLEYLNLNTMYPYLLVDGKIFGKINNFKLLKYLELTDFKFHNFELTLDNLESLVLRKCDNIKFAENIFLNLKTLELKYCNLNVTNYLLACPNVENCILYSKFEKEMFYKSIIDFTSLKKLTVFKGNVHYFSLLEDVCLEKLSINKDDIISLDIIKKGISMNSLKTISLKLDKNLDEKILNIKYQNNSVTKLKVHINNCILYNLQNLFPNVSTISIHSNFQVYDKKSSLEIKENPNCKIINIKIKMFSYMNTKLFCYSFEKLESVEFFIHKKIDLNKTLPLFSPNCKIIFHNLISFKLKSEDYSISYNIVNNIRNNINNMPNLKNFEFDYENNDYDSKKFNKFIEAILSLKFIKTVKIRFSLGYKYVYDKTIDIKYSKYDIMNLFPQTKQTELYQFDISMEKLEKKDCLII